ncbi:MAG TPA: 50S ribosomal protein L4 [Candidatus Kapabacteria bacterium]|nr:50S ribosomal protein L4 [Candidatus Kapabacteria bacterium]
MANAPLYNQNGEKIDVMNLSDVVFGIEPNVNAIHQVYVAERANAREPWADTKNRGEVRGGGRKPWQQKGTGRARHGSIRSPIWKGGGITFGPLSVRSYKQKVNKKMSAVAVKMCLADKAKSDGLFVVDALPTSGKTKDIVAICKNIPGGDRPTIVLVGNTVDAMVKRATNNLGNVVLRRAQDVTVVDLLHAYRVIATKDSIAALEKRFA